MVPALGLRNLVLNVREIINEPDGRRKYLLTIEDVTERRQITAALVTAKRQAEQANLVKSRFLAAASHDLRQPLQALVLLIGLLAKKIERHENDPTLISRFNERLDSMSSMLSTLLDINQLETGAVRARVVDFPIDSLIYRLKVEFAPLADSRGLDWRVVPCRLMVRSDPSLLVQMVRNLVSNAMNYTFAGKILLGCRRVGASLRIEVWDTGVGIPVESQAFIFKEYYRITNSIGEERSRGLGLAIVELFAKILEHPITVRSSDRGSIFTISTPLVETVPPIIDSVAEHAIQKRTLLVVENDMPIRESLTGLLEAEGYHVVAVATGVQASAAAARKPPDLVVADYTLPGDMNGLDVIARLRRTTPLLPGIILTGDISNGVTDEIVRHRCRSLTKPVSAADFLRHIQDVFNKQEPHEPFLSRLSEDAQLKTAVSAVQEKTDIFLVDDDDCARTAMVEQLIDHGLKAEAFSSGEAFLNAIGPDRSGCLIVDARMPGMDGLALLERLKIGGYKTSAIMISGYGDISLSVAAMKAGAVDFIEKPIRIEEILESINRVIAGDCHASVKTEWQVGASSALLDALTPRQRHILDLVLAGRHSKNIAAELGISRRTVENHRAAIMKSLGAKSLPELTRLVLTSLDKP
ncbi:two-component system, sensor histidine kinase [Azospirillaceae bacterium]